MLDNRRDGIIVSAKDYSAQIPVERTGESDRSELQRKLCSILGQRIAGRFVFPVRLHF
jgi:hypothetical protein